LIRSLPAADALLDHHRVAALTGPAGTVVVCTRGRPAALQRCLDSLVSMDHASYEIVVVDNSTGDADTRAAAAEAGARYVLERIVGLSRARNTGAMAAEGRVVAYLDDDCVASPSWLTRHTDALDDPALGASTGRVLAVELPDPAAQAYRETMTEDLGPVARRVGPRSPWWFEVANFAGLGIGCNMAFERALFESGLRFRLSLGVGTPIPGAEENNAFFEVIRRGHEVAYLPDAVVHHYGSSRLSDLRRRRVRMMRGGAAYMLMLLIEEPEYRWRTLRYMAEGVLGRERSWRPGRGGAMGPPRRELAAAALAAPGDYWRARRVERQAAR